MYDINSSWFQVNAFFFLFHVGWQTENMKRICSEQTDIKIFHDFLKNWNSTSNLTTQITVIITLFYVWIDTQTAV